MNYKKYSVAGIPFELVFDDGIVNENLFCRYKPFKVENGSPFFTLKVEVCQNFECGELVKKIGTEAPVLWLFNRGEGYCVGFSLNDEEPVAILVDSILYVREEVPTREVESCINNALMFLYTSYAALDNALLLHASVVNHNGYGYMFLGCSGTGKSTHSRLWIENITGTQLLNDDNPIIRICGDNIIVSGSPWSGKTPCYKNKQIPLGGIVRLTQAKSNKITRLYGLPAYAALLPSCSVIKWDAEVELAVNKSIEQISSTCPIWHLECLPDREAAILCNKFIKVK